MFACPEKLKNVNAGDINPSYLYSYWITIQFIIYLIAYLSVPRKVPTWLNPYPFIIFTIIAQILFFTLSYKVIPVYFLIGVAVWKLLLIGLTLWLLPADWSWPTLAFNTVLFTIYWLYMRYWLGVDLLDFYGCIISYPKYYPSSPLDFIKVRFPYLFN